MERILALTLLIHLFFMFVGIIVATYEVIREWKRKK